MEFVILLFLTVAVTTLVSHRINQTYSIREMVWSVAEIFHYQPSGGYSSDNTLQNKTEYSASNTIRAVSQNAALRLGLQNPVFGIGLGQFGFYLPEFIIERIREIEDSEVRNTIQKFIRNSPSSPWPPTYSLFMRILAELGFIGLGIWLLIWITIIAQFYRHIVQKDNHVNLFMVSLLTCTIGMIVVMFSHDSFRYSGYWITLGLLSLCSNNAEDI